MSSSILEFRLDSDIEKKKEWKASIQYAGISCGNVTRSYIFNDAIPDATLFASVVEITQGRRGRLQERLVAYALVDENKYPSFYYLLVICSVSPGAGSFLMGELEKYAKKKRKRGLALSSLHEVIGYYRSRGFLNNSTCFPENPILTDYFQEKIYPLLEQEKKEAKAEKRNVDFDTIVKKRVYVKFLGLLKEHKLVEKKGCKTIADCNIHGYVMFKCFIIKTNKQTNKKKTKKLK